MVAGKAEVCFGCEDEIKESNGKIRVSLLCFARASIRDGLMSNVWVFPTSSTFCSMSATLPGFALNVLNAQ